MTRLPQTEHDRLAAARRARAAGSGLGRRRLAWLGLLVLIGSAPLAAAEPAQIAELRARALDHVNRARQDHGLPSLELGEPLNAAASAHAQDMLRRQYYAHESPEGDTVQDRYVEAGGSRWRLVAENIARCAACDPPVTRETVATLHEGWMNSPEHRANILAPGLTRFGFGIAVDQDQGLYAVQTFAGPGRPRGLQSGEAAPALDPGEQAARALRVVNRARQRAGVAPLEASEALRQAARQLASAGTGDQIDLGGSGGILSALPPEQRTEWRSVQVLAAACGGCGTEPTAADIRSFGQQWLDNPDNRSTLLDPSLTHLGFALTANGEGRKVAIAAIGRQH